MRCELPVLFCIINTYLAYIGSDNSKNAAKKEFNWKLSYLSWYTVFMKIITRFLPKIKQSSFFLFGPRGTGKSLWLQLSYPDSYLIDLLQPDTRLDLEAHPEKLRSIVKGNPHIRTYIIDEVQKVPELLTLVHFLIEKNSQLQFVLTGSSSRKLKKSGVDMLAGRALDKRCHPFMASELGDSFDLDRALQWGLIPLIWNEENPQAALSAYLQLYLKEEIQIEGFVRNLGSFSRFLEAVSFSHGSVMNTSAIARECKVERKTVSGYIQVLEDVLISFRLPVFSRRAKRQLIIHEKFYFFDAGIYNRLHPRGPIDRPEEIYGAALEGLVLQHLKAWKDYGNQDVSLYYWRTKSGLEVDFIIYGENVFTALEVKSSSTIHPKDLRGLKAFRDDYPESSQVLLYRGIDRLEISGILCLPVEDFLMQLIPGNSLIY